MSFHNIRDSKGKFTQGWKKSTLFNKATIPVVKKLPLIRQKELVNHIAIVLDRSSSMGGIRNDVVAQFNKQVEVIKENVVRTGQKTYVTLQTFATNVDAFNYFDVDVNKLKTLDNSDYVPSGMTALFDAIGKTVETLEKFNLDKNDDSFLVIVITDGEENQSRHYAAIRLTDLIKRVTKTDRWSFAFLVPPGGKDKLLTFGVPEGNIQEWEATHRGTEIATRSLSLGTSSYFTGRTQGLASTQSYFTPDLTNVTAAKMQRKLEDASTEFLRLNVNHDCRIDKYVDMATGNLYVIGSGYYQLTKSEKVQDYKGIIIREKSTNKLFAGRNGEDLKEVRRMLKLPTNTIQLHKNISPDFDIFIKSTSVNRKLLSGTILLLDKTVI